MASQRFVHDSRHGEIVHQSYSLPWPLKPRELLMRCTNEVSRATHSVSARCASVHTDRVPITSSAVRMEIIESLWKFESLPNERTRITVELAISETFAVGVPSFIIDYVQKHSLKESMRNFERATKRLKLAAHPQFVGWRRTREQIRRLSGAAAAVAAAEAASAGGASPFCLEGVQRAVQDFIGGGGRSSMDMLAAVVALVAAAAAASHTLRSCLRRRKQTRAWRRWQRFEARRGKERREVAAPVRGRAAAGAIGDRASSDAQLLLRGYAAGHATGAGGLVRSFSELCIAADAGPASAAMPNRSFSASSL